MLNLVVWGCFFSLTLSVELDCTESQLSVLQGCQTWQEVELHTWTPSKQLVASHESDVFSLHIVWQTGCHVIKTIKGVFEWIGILLEDESHIPWLTSQWAAVLLNSSIPGVWQCLIWSQHLWKQTWLHHEPNLASVFQKCRWSNPSIHLMSQPDHLPVHETFRFDPVWPWDHNSYLWGPIISGNRFRLAHPKGDKPYKDRILKPFSWTLFCW